MASREIHPVGAGCKSHRELKHNASIESPTQRPRHATVGNVTEEPEVPVPKDWHAVARSGLVHAVALARVALLQVLSDFENGRNPRARMLSEVERLRQRVQQLETELAIKDHRMAKLAPARRPHYSAPDRLQILLLQASMGWSLEETARRFLITAHTIASWKHKLDDLGEAALVRLAPPVNRFPDQVRQLVRDLKQLYPSMGRQRIADTLARTGLVLAASTVRRMVLETPGEPDRKSVV